MATSASTAMMTRPTIALRSPSNRRQRRNPFVCCRAEVSDEIAALADSETPWGASMASIILAIANPWIEEGVDDIDKQVGHDEDDGDEQDYPLHDGVVPVKDGADKNPPDAADREDRLHDHGAAQQEGELDANDGHHRDQRVAHGMTQN